MARGSGGVLRQEVRVCSYFVNMSYIERIAGALFLSLARRLDDPTLAAIFHTFHTDELRHSHAAARLADYFDVHHYRVYTPNIPMLRFIPSGGTVGPSTPMRAGGAPRRHYFDPSFRARDQR